MIKTILVPTSGSSTDQSVFATALAVARPSAAHLHFFHVHVTAGVAAQRAHVEFCQGAAISSALQTLTEQADGLSAAAVRNYEAFRRTHGLETCEAPAAIEAVTVHRSEETDEPLARLLFHARHSDLVVVGRRRNQDRLPDNLIQALLVDGGRPVLIAPETPPRTVGGTVVVGWKETPEAARAVTAAMPLLTHARRVFLLNVAEEHAAQAPINDLARQLRWHGIRAEVNVMLGQPAAQQIMSFALRQDADLLVVGGFGHAPLREWVFGGVTQALIEDAQLPVFMVH